MRIFKRTRHKIAQKRIKNRKKMENITIIATIKAIDNSHLIADKDFLKEAKLNGKIYTLKEFEYACNRDEINLKSVFIRVLEVSKSSFRLV